MTFKIVSIEHEILANKMYRTDHIIERDSTEYFGGFPRIEVRFGNFDPGPDNKLPGEQVAQAFKFCVPGLRLKEARIDLIWANVPVFGKADLGNTELDGALTHGFQSIVAIFGIACMQVIINRYH